MFFLYSYNLISIQTLQLLFFVPNLLRHSSTGEVVAQSVGKWDGEWRVLGGSPRTDKVLEVFY